MKPSVIAKNVKSMIKKKSPEILTGIGIGGMIATTIMAVRATPKALTLIEKREDKWMEDHLGSVEDSYKPLPKVEVIKAAWRCYIPAAITGSLSIACLVSANSVNARRNAALATAYTISETALREYKDKVVETIGEKKEKEVRDSIAKDKLDRNPVTKNEVVVTEKGNTLCYDVISGRYFKSDMEKLKRAENELNRQMLNDGSVSLNDFYYAIGLDNIRLGDDLGWDTRDSLITLDFSSQLATDGTPCLVLDFSIAPRYDYYK